MVRTSTQSSAISRTRIRRRDPQLRFEFDSGHSIVLIAGTLAIG